jgi:NAD(P)-dependent dehydrogenase (short-subunit alcohol dehydrogenase family)
VVPEDCEKVVKEIEGMGVHGLAVKCDVSSRAEVEQLVSATIQKFGKLDILVNNAAIFPIIPFAGMSDADWDRILGINLKGTFMLSQAAAKVMKPGSKIVSISSVASIRGFAGLAHYGASKAGINGLTMALALELAPARINVNAVAPGGIDTPGWNEVCDEEVKKQTIQMIPWKRMGVPEDIANAVVFLASGRSDYITGQVIVVDGGLTIK